MTDPKKSVLAHDKEMARRFLAGLDPNATKFTFQFFGDGARRYAEIPFHGTLDEVWPKVLALNTAQRAIGVFVTINETDFKGRKAENIVRPRALFGDADGDEQAAYCRDAIKNFEATPSMIVKTGRGQMSIMFAPIFPVISSQRPARVFGQKVGDRSGC